MEIIQHPPGDSRGIKIPEGCQGDWPLIRVLESGWCSFKELTDGTYDMNDVFNMCCLLDLKDYVEAVEFERSRE